MIGPNAGPTPGWSPRGEPAAPRPPTGAIVGARAAAAAASGPHRRARDRRDGEGSDVRAVSRRSRRSSTARTASTEGSSPPSGARTRTCRLSSSPSGRTVRTAISTTPSSRVSEIVAGADADWTGAQTAGGVRRAIDELPFEPHRAQLGADAACRPPRARCRRAAVAARPRLSWSTARRCAGRRRRAAASSSARQRRPSAARSRRALAPAITEQSRGQGNHGD